MIRFLLRLSMISCLLVCTLSPYAQSEAKRLYDLGDDTHGQSDFAYARQLFDSSRTIALDSADYVMYFKAYGMLLECLDKNAEIRRLGVEIEGMKADLLRYEDEISKSDLNRFWETCRLFEMLNLTYLGDTDGALEAFLPMLDSLNALNPANDKTIAVQKFKVLHYISLVYLKQGNSDQTNYYANEAILLTPLLPNTDGWLLKPRFTKATNYTMTGQIEKAIAELKDIVNLDPEIVQRREERVAEAYLKIAQLHLKINHPDSALYYLTLIKQMSRVGLEAELESGLLESEIHYLAANYSAANESCRKVSKILTHTNAEHGDMNARCKLQLGKIAMKQGVPKEALQLLHSALMIFTEHFDNTDPLSNPSIRQLYRGKIPVEIIYYKSKVLSDLYASEGDQENLQASWQTISLGVDFIDRLRQSYYDPEDKAFLIEQSYRVFSQALSLCHGQFAKPNNESWADTAFALMERSKALNLMDAVKQDHARQFAGIPDSILEIESQLRLEITLRQESIREMHQSVNSDKDLVLRTLSTLEKEKKTYRAFLNSIEEDHPEYYQLRYGSAKITLSDIQQLINADESVVEYFAGEKNIFTLVIEKDRTRFYQNADAGDVEDLIVKYKMSIQACVEGVNNKANDSIYIDAAVELYDILVKPLLPLKKSIVVIQDGPLYYLSFAGLITKTPTQYYDWRKHAYMVLDHDISYCYSMTLCHDLRNKVMADTDHSMIFAPEFEQDADVSQLTFNGEEAKQVARMTSGESLMSEQCTSEAVRKTLANASRYRLIHFATHGVANTANGTDSYLQFAGPPESNKLYARELYNYSLNADLVYLSACETGSGQLLRGEGVISIARAFFYAGTRSLVTALWSISDERAKDLTIGFYDQLMDGKSVDVSVANSQRRYIKSLNTEQRDLAHPAYWSALVPFGSSSAIIAQSGFSWIFYLAGLFIAMLVLVRYFKNKRVEG